MDPVALTDDDLTFRPANESFLILVVLRFSVGAAEDGVEHCEDLTVSERAVVPGSGVEVTDPALQRAEFWRLTSESELGEEDEGVEVAVLGQGCGYATRERVSRSCELVRDAVKVVNRSPEWPQVDGVLLVGEELGVLRERVERPDRQRQLGRRHESAQVRQVYTARRRLIVLISKVVEVAVRERQSRLCSLLFQSALLERFAVLAHLAKARDRSRGGGKQADFSFIVSGNSGLSGNIRSQALSSFPGPLITRLLPSGFSPADESVLRTCLQPPEPCSDSRGSRPSVLEEDQMRHDRYLLVTLGSTINK